MNLEELLQFQLKCFEKFLDTTEKYLKQETALQDEEAMARLMKRRECTLKTLDALDQHIKGQIAQRDIRFSEQWVWTAYLKNRTDLLTKIRKSDQRLFDVLGTELKQIQIDLNRDHETREKLGRFKSHVDHSGHEFDRRY